MKLQEQEHERGDQLMEPSGCLIAPFAGELRALFREDLTLGFKPAFIARRRSQGQHGVDMSWSPSHSRPFKPSLDDAFGGALDHARSDGPALQPVAGILEQR
jgi:hypothetical protein